MKKKFTVKKILLLIILVLILSVVGFVANAFNGNPISKYLAKREYNNYIEETYPDTDFRINKVYYNFKDGNYWVKAKSESKKIEFGLSRRYDDVIEDEYRDQPTLVDNTVSIKFKNKITNEVMNEILEVNNIDYVRNIFVDMSFPQGKYDGDVEFSKDMDEEFKIQISLSRESIKEREEKLKEFEKKSLSEKIGIVEKDKEVTEKEVIEDKKLDKQEEYVEVIDKDFIDKAYKIKEIIINMGYIGLTEIGFEFVDSNYNYEYILLNKEQFNTFKDELINFKQNGSSIFEKDGDEEELLRLQEEIRLALLEEVRNIEEFRVYENILSGSRDNSEAYIKILKEDKPTKEELAKETFYIKELIRNKYPGIKYLYIDFYEYGELNAKGGNWGQYYGSIFIGNEFSPWEITEDEVNIKLKIWDKL